MPYVRVQMRSIFMCVFILLIMCIFVLFRVSPLPPGFADRGEYPCWAGVIPDFTTFAWRHDGCRTSCTWCHLLPDVAAFTWRHDGCRTSWWCRDGGPVYPPRMTQCSGGAYPSGRHCPRGHSRCWCDARCDVWTDRWCNTLWERFTRWLQPVQLQKEGPRSNEVPAPGKTTWRCSVRSKTLTCRATVLQDGDTFTRGLHPHVHPADPTTAVKARVTAKVKTAAVQKKNVFTPASDLVEEAIADEDTAAPLPAPGNIARAANRLRHKHRPDEPHGLDFELAEDYIPQDFLVKDICMDGARHILFSAPDQLAVGACADMVCRWNLQDHPWAIPPTLLSPCLHQGRLRQSQTSAPCLCLQDATL